MSQAVNWLFFLPTAFRIVCLVDLGLARGRALDLNSWLQFRDSLLIEDVCLRAPVHLKGAGSL